MTDDRFDHYADAVALVRAAIAQDREAACAILDHCVHEAVIAELCNGILQIGAAAYGDETELDWFLRRLQQRARDTVGST